LEQQVAVLGDQAIVGGHGRKLRDEGIYRGQQGGAHLGDAQPYLLPSVLSQGGVKGKAKTGLAIFPIPQHQHQAKVGSEQQTKALLGQGIFGGQGHHGQVVDGPLHSPPLPTGQLRTGDSQNALQGFGHQQPVVDQLSPQAIRQYRKWP
jgi:hypothetical protein